MYYVCKTDITLTDGKPVAVQTVLTRPDTLRAANEALRRYERIGIENIAVCKKDAKSYKKIMRAQAKRRKKVRKLTTAEVAEIIGEVEKIS